MINDRLLTLLGGILSVLLVIALLLPPVDNRLENISLPTSVDNGESGLKALSLLLTTNKIPVISLRQRYQSLLFDLDLSDKGNLIIIHQPAVTPPGAAELDALNEWLRAGNFALILVAHQDQPDWFERLSSRDSSRFLSSLGYRLSPGVEEKTRRDNSDDDEPADVSMLNDAAMGQSRIATVLLPAMPHPLLKGVNSISSYHVEPTEFFMLTGGQSNRFTVAILKEDKEDKNTMWAFRQGEGGGWVSSLPDMFGNVTLGEADNARFFSNIINQALGENGAVIFDDMHLGLSDLYDPDNFFKDSRLHNTVWLIALLWLIYLLAYSNRLAPVKPSVPAAGTLDFVEAMAGFFARKTDAKQVAEKLLRRFDTEVSVFYRQADSTSGSSYRLLRQHAMIREDEITMLESFDEKISRNKSVNLKHLINTIDRIRSMMHK